jgi:hypothetical protein
MRDPRLGLRRQGVILAQAVVPDANVHRAMTRCYPEPVWTCNKDTKEQAHNDGNVVAIMRITDLKA